MSTPADKASSSVTTPSTTESPLSLSTSPSSVSTTASTVVHYSPLFHGPMVVYRAGSTLFHVAHYGQSSETKEFEAKFRNVGVTNGPGSSDDCPIIIDSSVSSLDFTLFLQILYHTPGSFWVSSGSMTLESWSTVLRLCNLWDLSLLRFRVVTEIEKGFPKSLASEIDKVILGKQLGVSKWVKDGCSAFTFRDGSMSPAEKGKFSEDKDTYAKLLEVRERRVTWTVSNFQSLAHTTRCSIAGIKERFDFDEAFRDAFGTEISAATTVSPPLFGNLKFSFSSGRR